MTAQEAIERFKNELKTLDEVPIHMRIYVNLHEAYDARLLAVSSLEKQMSKKPIEKHYEEPGEIPYIKMCCPNGCPVQVSKFDNYCNKCGQKLGWDAEA